MGTEGRMTFNLDKADSLEGAIYEAIGAASMCWINIPTGEFDSTKAKELAEELVDEVRRRVLDPTENLRRELSREDNTDIL